MKKKISLPLCAQIISSPPHARSIALVLCALIMLMPLSACVSVNFSGFDTVAGTGEPVLYEFGFGEITFLDVSIYCDIVYYSELSENMPSGKVTLEIQENLMEHITLSESGGRLTVRSSKMLDTYGHKPTLTIYAPSLDRVALSGAGDFTAHDKIEGYSFSISLAGAGSAIAEFDVKELFADISGAGEFYFSGTADKAEFNLSGAGDINALYLETQMADITLSGAGSVSVSCYEHLRLKASGVGNVRYRGSPTTEISTSGLVSVTNE
ncbi:MAG: DUF2807 domain-containing protein [Oscillospiraceae bacterium]|nr:DUF2807 domain-containing protein [Oscillospiraceae bacterium]